MTMNVRSLLCILHSNASSMRLFYTALLCIAVITTSLVLCQTTGQELQDDVSFAATVTGGSFSFDQPVDSPHTAHCAMHCAHMVLPALLFSAVYMPNQGTPGWKTSRLFARLGLPPLLPPPEYSRSQS